MKKFNIIWGLTFLMSASSFANITLKPSLPVDSYPLTEEKAAQFGLSSVKVDAKQSFAITANPDEKFGTLIQGKGWLTKIHPACFVAWSTADKPNAFFMLTMGAGDWDTVDCDKIKSVGVISKHGDKNIKIAVIYSVSARGRNTQDYIVLGMKGNKDIYYDESATGAFQNSYIKDLAAMRKEYQRLISNNK